MAVEMYARGLSTRDIEALFADEAGKSLLSRTAVSEITERLWAEYEAFASRDLSEFEVIYLFVDGIAERLHLGQPCEAVLAAWAILAERAQQCLRRVHGEFAGGQCRENGLGLLRWRPLEVDWCLDRRRLGDGDRTARPGVGWVPRDRSSHQRRGSEANNDRPIDVAVIDIKMPASSEANGTIFLLQFNFAFLHSATAPNEPKSRR
jgi:Transposase, Mutator family